MKKNIIQSPIYIMAEKNTSADKWTVDYYLILNDNRRLYAFTRGYKLSSYNFCKSGVLLNDLILIKTKNHELMTLSSYTNRMIPYLIDYYDLKIG